MSNQLKIAVILTLVLISSSVKGQVLISLLFGEKLNSDKIEFGLIGGFNQSYLLDIEESKGLINFNLGFYFHFNIKPNSYISTGVLVKSNVGATGMPVYATGDAEFDSVFYEGKLTTQINYFYVPIMYQYRIKNRVYFEVGFQAGLRGKAYDIFTKEYNGGDLEFIRDVRDDYKYLDAGLMGGFGYKFRNQIKSMSIGLRYYYGLVNVSTLPDTNLKNSSLYLFFKIPIGVAKPEVEEG